MKISLALGNPQALSRQTAWGCLTTNLAMPGFGSLVGGRRVGYVQAILGLVAFAITAVSGTRFIIRALSNWSVMYGPQADSLNSLLEMWGAAHWPLIGIFLFVLAWLWSLATSFSIINAAKKAEKAKVPPVLQQ